MARLLAAWDPATLTWSRDLTMLTLVALLVLRCLEVARLELDDIDWRSRGKARSVDRLPLMIDAGCVAAAAPSNRVTAGVSVLSDSQNPLTHPETLPRRSEVSPKSGTRSVSATRSHQHRSGTTRQDGESPTW